MAPQQRPIPGPQASARHTEEGERFNKTLFSALDALEAGHISYALIGGIAASGLGRPRSTHDIDIFVRPEDAESALSSLKLHGFETEKTDERWLFKGFKDNHMVDIIFKSSGDIYFDDEMKGRAQLVNYHGRQVRVVSPEDLIIIKCAVHNEGVPQHWHDALSILSHAPVDWSYLLKRSRKAPRRLLALLIYAQSNDILIPNSIIEHLHQTIFHDTHIPVASPAPRASSSQPRGEVRIEHPGQGPSEYIAGRIKEALAQDGRTGMLDVRVYVRGDHIVVKGECLASSQLTAVEQVVHDLAPEHIVDNQLRLTNLPGPESVEVIQ